MQLTHSLKGAWFQPLDLSSDILVSKFAFLKMDQPVPLRRGGKRAHRRGAGEGGVLAGDVKTAGFSAEAVGVSGSGSGAGNDERKRE